MSEEKKQNEDVLEEQDLNVEDNDLSEDETEVSDDQSEDESNDHEATDPLAQENEELKQRLARLQADYDNFRKRTRKEKEEALKYKSQELVATLLPVVDNFERALAESSDSEDVQSFMSGIELVYKQLMQALEEAGVEIIEGQGDVFDPNEHQAIAQVTDENYDSQVIVEVLQKGYRLKDRVLRPAMVKVNE